jgi:riboflavin kinase / FMN adenylyltransferase
MFKIARFHTFSAAEIAFFQSKYAAQKWVVAIGNFDGVHLGHQFLLQTVYEQAALWQAKYPDIKIEKGVISFQPHPRIFFAKSGFQASSHPHSKTQAFQSLQNLRNHADSLRQSVDWLFLLNFKHLHSKRADEFLAHLAALHIIQIVIGEDFRCGHHRSTGALALKTLALDYNIATEIVPFLANPNHVMAGQKISSSGIRELLKAVPQDAVNPTPTQTPPIARQKLQLVKQQLGRYFEYSARVQAGKRLGRTIGFPTLNMHLPADFILPFGVYATFILMDGVWYQSITNLGRRPTVDATALIETHITDERFKEDFNKSLPQGAKANSNTYGYLKLAFTAYHRDQQKFSTLEELKTAIQKDIEWRMGLNDESPRG